MIPFGNYLSVSAKMSKKNEKNTMMIIRQMQLKETNMCDDIVNL